MGTFREVILLIVRLEMWPEVWKCEEHASSFVSSSKVKRCEYFRYIEIIRWLWWLRYKSNQTHCDRTHETDPLVIMTLFAERAITEDNDNRVKSQRVLVWLVSVWFLLPRRLIVTTRDLNTRSVHSRTVNTQTDRCATSTSYPHPLCWSARDYNCTLAQWSSYDR